MNDELAIARVNNAKDNTKIKPLDLLKTAIADIESGKVIADGLIVVFVSNRDAKRERHETWRCGLGNYEELGALTLATHRAIAYLVIDDD